MRISDWSSDVCSSDLGTPSVLVLLNPAFVNRGRFRPAIRAVEENHLPLVAVSFEEGLQILLRAARLGENQRLTRCAGRGHLLESDVQRLEERSRFGVDADTARPSSEPLDRKSTRLNPSH